MSAAFVIDLSTFPDAQRAAVQALLEEVAALMDIIKRQEHLIAELNHALHGKRSEKLTEDERQLAFEDLSIALAEVEAEKEKRAAKAGDGATRPAPRRTVPAQLRVIVIVRPKYACRTCTDGVTQGEPLCAVGSRTMASAPGHLIMGGLPTEAALAHVLVSKYADHLPLYRQSQVLARAGLDLHRAALADWVGKAAYHLKPVVDRLAEHLKRSGRLFMDETTAPGAGASTPSTEPCANQRSSDPLIGI
jgi:transposase